VSASGDRTRNPQPGSGYVSFLRYAKVVVAEDDPELRSLMADGLRRDGYDVEEAEDGFALTDRIERTDLEPVDLIVSDVLMPGRTGLEFLMELRNPFRPGVCDTPVILITAFGDDQTHHHADSLGAFLFDKPFDVDDLRTCAINLVSPRQLIRSRAVGTEPQALR
jgi:DNA-binding response OmpR family regulator